MTISFPRIEHPFLIRCNTTDVGTVVNNFIRQEYGQFPNRFRPEWIVDGGAYIGDTSAYFLSRYRSAKLIALEPTADNYRVLTKNLKPYGDRVILEKAALGSEEGAACMIGSGTGARVAKHGSEDVAVTTIPAILKRVPQGRIGLLKLDIEGAERDVLGRTCSAWLDRVDAIIVETHGPESERAVFRTLNLHGWSRRRYRNLWYCMNPRSRAT